MDHRYIQLPGQISLIQSSNSDHTSVSIVQGHASVSRRAVKICETWTLIGMLQASPTTSLRLWCSSLDELGDEKYRRVDTDPVWQYTEEKKRLYAHMIGKVTCYLLHVGGSIDITQRYLNTVSVISYNMDVETPPIPLSRELLPIVDIGTKTHS